MIPGDSFILRLILAGLACYRLAQFVSLDNGPWNVFDRVRIATEQAVARHPTSHFWKSIAELASCPYCQGVYAGILCASLVLWPTTGGDMVLLWLGIVGVQAFLQSTGNRE
ncbi:MAG: DUF1360 domain-containing protein [Nitrospiria bacterium]